MEDEEAQAESGEFTEQLVLWVILFSGVDE